MLRKCYWYKIQSNGKDIGDGVVSVWFWQGQVYAHRKAVLNIKSVFNDSFSFSEFRRVY